MKLIVGLGNPGKDYENTRHNIGFRILDKYLGNVKWSKKLNGEYYETNINGEKYIFLKPLSYMNLSGGVVGSYVKFFKLGFKDVLIIQDDLDQELGAVKLKINSSAGGHNGIKDIIASLHTDAFARIKIGVAHDRSIDTKDYVLGKFGKSELEKIDTNLDKIFYVIENFKYENIEALMVDFNRKG